MGRVLKALRKGWDSYRNNFTSYFTGMAIFLVVMFFFAFASFFVLFDVESFQGIETREDLVSILAAAPQQNIIAAYILIFVGIAWSIFILGGVIATAAADMVGWKAKTLNMINNVIRTKWAQIFISFFIAYVISVFVFGVLAVFLPSIALMLVMLAIGALFIFLEIEIVLEDVGVLEAFKKIISTIGGGFLEVLALFFMFSAMWIVIGQIPTVRFLLQVFFVIPLVVTTFTAYYLSRRK